MSQLQKTGKSNSFEGLKPHSRPSLQQTRRHSWFGASQEVETVQNGFVNSSDIYDIQEETSADVNKHENNNGSWLNANNRWSQINSSAAKEGGNENGNNPVVKRISFQSDIEKGSMEGEKTQKRFGLRRQASNSNNTPTKSTAKKTPLPKRRSGIGSILTGNNLASLNRTPPSTGESGYLGGRTEKPSLATLMRQTSVNGDSRHWQRRATVHYSSTGRPSLMDSKKSSLQHGLRPDESRALEQFKDVCRDYLVYRLRQRNLANRVVIDRQQSKCRWLSQDIVYINNELEKLQKCRFSDISKQIGITLRSEDVLRKVFFELSTEIITTEHRPHHTNGVHRSSDGNKRRIGGVNWMLKTSISRMTEITWGRICAVLAVAGGLAVDCVSQGHADLVNYLIEYIGDFALDEGILTWIVQQGGWESIRDLTYESSSRVPNLDSCYFNKLTNIALAFVACTVGAVLGAVALGGSSSIEES